MVTGTLFWSVSSRKPQVIIGVFPGNATGFKRVRFIRNTDQSGDIVVGIKGAIKIEEELGAYSMSFVVVVFCQGIRIDVDHRILQIGWRIKGNFNIPAIAVMLGQVQSDQSLCGQPIKNSIVEV